MADNARHEDPIEVMTEIMDGFTEYVLRTETAVRQGRSYRLNLLWVHAIFALMMAPAFAALGQDGMEGTAWTYIRKVPHAPDTIAGLLFIGGFILGIGCIMRHRKIEVSGLIFLTAFYATIAIGFGLATVDWYQGDITGGKPAPYAPILYTHLTFIMGVHFVTLTRLIRGGVYVPR